MQIAAYIFDLDGTLADTLDGIVHSLNATLADLDLPTHECDAYRQFIGDGVLKLVERALPADQQHRVDEVLAQYVPRLEGEGGAMAQPFPGVDEVLSTLTGLGIPFAVLSNKPHAATVDVVQTLFGQYPFAGILGAGHTFPLKPSPAGARHLAHAMGVSFAQTAYVGDSDVDMQTAKNASMVAVGAAYGMRGEKELREHGAEIILHQPRDLLQWLQADI